MHPCWSMVTGVVGTGVCGNDPWRRTKTFARPPSALATTVSWMTRFPALILLHMGSLPILMIGLPGSFPMSRTWPLIAPRPAACAAAALSCPPMARIAPNRHPARGRATRFFILGVPQLLLRLFLLLLFRFRLEVLELVRIPVLQMAILAGGIDMFSGVGEAFHVLGVDRLQRRQHSIVKCPSKFHEGCPVLIDPHLDLFGSQFDARVLRLFPWLGHMAAGHLQEVGRFDERDRAT